MSRKLHQCLTDAIFPAQNSVPKGTVTASFDPLVQNGILTARSVSERCNLPCAEYCPGRTLSGRCVFPCVQAPCTKVSGRYFVFLCAEQWPKESSVWRMSSSVPSLCAKWPSKRSRLWMSSPCQQHSICAEWCSKRNCPWLSSSPCQPC